MKRLILSISIPALACLAACGGGDTNNHGYGWEYDVKTANVGLRINYHNVDPSNLDSSPERMESWYLAIESCAGVEAEAPLVVVVPEIRVVGGGAGYIYYDTGLIILSQYAIVNDPFVGRVLRHEFLHYLLWSNGLNAGHDNPLFEWCGVDAIEERLTQ